MKTETQDRDGGATTGRFPLPVFVVAELLSEDVRATVRSLR